MAKRYPESETRIEQTELTEPVTLVSAEILQEKRIEENVAKWQTILDLGHISVENVFTNDESNNDCGEVIDARYEYRDAVITWNIARTQELSDDDLELQIVHELAHIIDAPIGRYVPVNRPDLGELSAENITRAIIGTKKAFEQAQAAKDSLFTEPNISA